MNNLKELLTQIADMEATAAIITEDVDPRVRAGVEANVRNAKADLDMTRRKYMEQVMDSVIVIGVKGESSKEYADTAAKLGSLALDFNMICNRLEVNLSNRAVGPIYTSDAHFKLLDELAKIRLEYDMVQLPTPQINAYNDGIYDSPLGVAIGKLLLKNYGSGLESAVTRREIGKKALELKFSGKKLPVVLFNLDRDVDARFIPAAFTVIESNGKVTENVVKKKLNEIRTQINGKNKQTESGDEPETNETEEQ